MRWPGPEHLGLAYFASEVLLRITRRSRESDSSVQDANSLHLLWITILVSVALALLLADRWSIGSLPHSRLCVVTGFIIFVLGIALRWWSIVKLGRFFTVNVAIAKNHQLVESGPYRFVRHPSYTGALLAFLGFGLSLRNWISVLVILVPVVLAFVYRIKVEERALSTALGKRYLEYAQRTKRLFPFLY